MQNNQSNFGKISALSLAIGSLLGSAWAQAQDGAGEASEQPMEEVITVGRFMSAAESLTVERLEIPFSADFLGAEVIARAGDPDIASALRRVPGLTLIDNKFVYVRGLGERYSSVLVNQAAIPSPDLTRSVVPLDLFPTSIVESIKIQKSPSPDVPAAFGGGVIDIRTQGAPIAPIADISLNLGVNSLSDSNGLIFPGGNSPVPAPILEGIEAYGGQIGVSDILSSLRQSNALASLGEAQAIHQGFIDSLNTDNIVIGRNSLDSDLGGRITLGNSWDINDDWSIGASLLATAGDKYRNEDQTRKALGAPDTFFTDVRRTAYEDNSTLALNFGLNYLTDHQLEIGTYKINNDESVASIQSYTNSNIDPDERALVYESRYEERELTLTQISGSHTFVDTPWISSLLERWSLAELEASWFYSTADANASIPNRTRFQSLAEVDSSGIPLSEQLLPTSTAGEFLFLDLDDEQNSWGGQLELPLELERMGLTLTGGWWSSEKARSYLQYKINLNAVGVQESLLAGTPYDVFSSGNVTVDNGFDLTVGGTVGNESYVAAQKIDTSFGMVDMDFDSWRLTAGLRWENYQQAVLAFNPLDYGSSIITLTEQLIDPAQQIAVQEDDLFSSLALTFDGNGWLGSDDYQLRFSYGETVVRPDLREVAGSLDDGGITYIDPTLDVKVRGNPTLETSPIKNYEVRSEFYYGEGDNFTVALFYKDIQSPIESVQVPAVDTDIVFSFQNAESGSVTGLEFEGLKSLPYGMFLAGNVTVSDSEITLAPGTFGTNLTRRLTGHSEWVVNSTLGYDSANAKHSAYLNYNAFGERIFFAGVAGNDDAYELPFYSLGLVYTYFPTDKLQIQLKLDNILDEKREFEQINEGGIAVPILTQDVGVSWSAGVRWVF